MDALTVFIVEDDQIVALDLSESLKTLHYIIRGVSATAEDALDTLEKVALPDIVLIDIKLGGKIDGIELASLIKKNYGLPHLFLTAYADKTTLERAKQTNPYGYLTKPYTTIDIHTAITMAINKYKTEQIINKNKQLFEETLTVLDDAIITVDLDGYIQYANPSAYAVMKKDDTEMQGKHYKSVFTMIDDSFGQVKTDILNIRQDLKIIEQCYIIPQGSESQIPVECKIKKTPGWHGNDPGFVFIFRDLTYEHQMNSIKNRLSAIVQSTNDAVFSIDNQGTILTWNQGAEKLLGYERNEIEGDNIAKLIPVYLPNILPQVLEYIKTKQTHDYYETKWRKKNGEVIDVNLTLSLIPNGDEKIPKFSVIAKDVSERNFLERKIISAAEDERKRMGKELHDTLGQQLTGILFVFRAFKRSFVKGETHSLENDLDKIESYLYDAIEVNRNIARGNLSFWDKNAGCSGAIKELEDYVESFYHVTVHTKLNEINVLEDEIQTQLFQIIKEAVINACKHSQANDIYIYLSKDDEEVKAKVKDNGRGITEKSTLGLGQRIMYHRAQIIGAHLDIYSEKGEGTVVSCRVPIVTMNGE